MKTKRGIKKDERVDGEERKKKKRSQSLENYHKQKERKRQREEMQNRCERVIQMKKKRTKEKNDVYEVHERRIK